MCVCVCVSLRMHAQELGKYLGSIVDVVSQLALQEGDVGEVAMELLKYLLMDNTDVIHTTIARLDPLPQHPALAKMTRHCEKIQQMAGQRSFPKVTQLVFLCVLVLCMCMVYWVDERNLLLMCFAASNVGGRKAWFIEWMKGIHAHVFCSFVC